MSQPIPSIYRSALQISPERIAVMSDIDLNVIMEQLLRAQAYKCGSPLNEVRVNTEEKAGDEGSDGWTAKPATEDPWLGFVDTCWQFKAGKAGEPARLSGEVLKSIPKKTLALGGRFIVVASGSTSGKKGEDDRRDELIKSAKAAGLPFDKIDVIGSERLRNWCNEHPAIAVAWAGHPNGLWTFADWSSSEEHQVPWQSSEDVQKELDVQRTGLDFTAGNVSHLHICGAPGVGKTRFTLELCRNAAWCNSVIYIRQAADVRLLELIDSAVADKGVQLIVVADEVQPEQLLPLRDSIGRGNGRIRLITIGHSPTPDPTRIPSLLVKPLDRDAMTKVITGWYPAMPLEHVNFVMRFADGYVRLAHLAADAVAQNLALDMRRLLNRDEIRLFLDRMLGTGDRRDLYVVAVLDSVGWTEDKREEGEAIARHFGLDWDTVQAKIEDFNRRFGIVPRGGRYRYISPTPLGIYLALEAWNTYPDKLKSLPDMLPSDDAKEAYYARLQSMASNPQAREYARDELVFFFHLDDFIDVRSVRRWSALSAADPYGASRNILVVLSGASTDDRKRIRYDARRETVWTLVRLAWGSSSFHNAVKALALLAEAENEKWANNATAEFIARFQIFLGGTAVPYLERLSVLDELMEEGRSSLVSLVVRALAQAGNEHAFRMDSGRVSDVLPEVEWQPHTFDENLACLDAAITRLNSIAKLGLHEIQPDLVATAQSLSMLLRESPIRELVASFFDTVRGTYPETREPLRRLIAGIILSEKKYWKKLSAEELTELEKLETRFEDVSLEARLQQYVGPAPWDWEEPPDLNTIAKELIESPSALAYHWPWLTSGNASDAWRLGEVLAAVDFGGELAQTLPLLPNSGRDLRLLCGYVNTRRRTLGDEWYDGWVTSQFTHEPKPIALLFEVVWRCGATEAIAGKLASVLSQEQIDPNIVGQLGFGQWAEPLSVDVLESILRAMTATGHRETAIGILGHRLKSNSGEYDHWKPLALELVIAPELIRSSQMVSFFWKEVASILVADFARQIAAAIIRELANDRDRSGIWFVEHSEAAGILRACVVQDPHGAWQEMIPVFSTLANIYKFSIGFPKDILERMLANDVDAWIAERPEERAEMITHLMGKDLSTDTTLASRILGKYGDNEKVTSTFFSEYISGIWSGPASIHLVQQADSLIDVAKRTALPKLRRWAIDAARSLQVMAERDRKREEEEDLRRQ